MPLIDHLDVERVDDSTCELLEAIRSEHVDAGPAWARRRRVTAK